MLSCTLAMMSQRSRFLSMLGVMILITTSSLFAPSGLRTGADGCSHGWVLPRRHGWAAAGDIVAMHRKAEAFHLLDTRYLVSCACSAACRTTAVTVHHRATALLRLCITVPLFSR